MGLAAIPFGTAQAEDVVTIRVKKEEPKEPKGIRFTISQEDETGKCLNSVKILWRDKNEYPEPILHPNGWLVSCWGDSIKAFSHDHIRDNNGKYLKDQVCAFIVNLKTWRERYHNKHPYPDEALRKFASEFASAGSGVDSLRLMAYNFLKSGDKSSLKKAGDYFDLKFPEYIVCFSPSEKKVLGKRGKYAGYIGFGNFGFVLFRDADCFKSPKSRYVLAIRRGYKRECLCVFSDIPTERWKPLCA